jgi:hypothetical protein
MGLRLVLADVDEPRLAKAGKQIAAIAGEQNVITVPTDVSKMEEVMRLKERAYDAFGEVSCARLAPLFYSFAPIAAIRKKATLPKCWF